MGEFMKSLNFAHRGFSAEFLENTMESFQAAYEAGADGVELDVQLTRDGEVIIFHDATLERLTNATGWLAEWTAQELATVQMPKETTEGIKTYSIPTFQEYLDWVKDKDFLTNIEIKSITSEDYGLEKKVIEAVYQAGVEEKVLISSFHKDALLRVKEIDLTMECGLLTPGCNTKILQLTKALGVEYIHPHYTSITKNLVAEAEKLGLEMNVWTVNDGFSLERMLELAPLGIITDHPDRMRKLQERKTLALA
jgi:glycerophosphoryl diester phosphodiesterase